jgi:Mce-associated membrane protein
VTPVIAIGDTTTATDTVDETTAPPRIESAPSDSDDGHDGPIRSEHAVGRRGRRGARWARILAFAALPGLALVLASGAGYLKWQYDSARDDAAARAQSVAAATESTIAVLSYRPDTAEKQLTAARERLTGNFRDSYSSLIHDVVIPGAQQKQISAVATVPAAASVSATANRAVVLVFVDQTITAGTDAPTNTASSVKVTLDKIGDQWLISDFTPV